MTTVQRQAGAPAFPLLLLALAAALPAAGCTSKRPRDEEGALPLSIELARSSGEMELGEESGFGTIDFDAGRTRVEARISAGRGDVLGRVVVFREELDTRFESAKEYHGVGFGGRGSSIVGTLRPGTALVLPYAWDLGLAYSGDDFAGQSAESYFLELRGELGLGARLGALTPSVGLTTSALAGATMFDDPGFVDEGFTGFALGLYGDLRYHVPARALDVWVRGVIGALRSVEIGLTLGL